MFELVSPQTSNIFIRENLKINASSLIFYWMQYFFQQTNYTLDLLSDQQCTWCRARTLIVQWRKRKIVKITIGKKTWGYKVIAYIINNTRRMEEKKIKSTMSDKCKFICLLSRNWCWSLSWDATSISLLFVVEVKFSFTNPPLCLVKKNNPIL